MLLEHGTHISRMGEHFPGAFSLRLAGSRDARTVCSCLLHPEEEAQGCSWSHFTLKVVRQDANESLRDANDFPTKSSG